LYDFLTIVKALADENRLRVLCALRDREVCVCEITALLKLAPSTVSKHMAVLRQAHLVEGRKDGRWMYYRLAGKRAPAEVKEALRWVLTALQDNEQTARDRERLEQIICCPEENATTGAAPGEGRGVEHAHNGKPEGETG